MPSLTGINLQMHPPDFERPAGVEASRKRDGFALARFSSHMMGMNKGRILLALPPLIMLAIGFVLVELMAGLDREEAERKASERLTLYRQMIQGEYGKYRYLPYMIARDPRAANVLTDVREAPAANRYLAEMAENSGVDILFVMDTDGTTLAASNWQSDQTLVGQNYGFRPYFKQALGGREGQYFAIGLTTGRPGLFFARPTPVTGEPKGVSVVKVELGTLEETWSNGGEIVFATDKHGVIFLSSRPEWRYRTLSDLDTSSRREISNARQYADEPLRRIAEPGTSSDMLILGGNAYQASSSPVRLLDWTLHYLVPEAEARPQLWPIWAPTIGLSLLYTIGVLVVRGRRLRKASAALRQESMDLRALNDRLVDEISERKRVEKELMEAQRGLARSSRLAAVGEMSAAVVHELSQPLAALRMFVAGTRKFLEKGDSGNAASNLQEIDALQLRMAHLTQELKRIARPGESRIERVDLRESIRSAEKIVRSRFEETGVRLTMDLPDTALFAETAPLRVEQILVNLLRNGADAACTRNAGLVSLQATMVRSEVVVTVADNGEGVPQTLRDRIFDPFFSTKLKSGGMGLGLSISMRIAEDLGGALCLHENSGGGAVFELSLPALTGDPVPAVPQREVEPGE